MSIVWINEASQVLPGSPGSPVRYQEPRAWRVLPASRVWHHREPRALPGSPELRALPVRCQELPVWPELPASHA
jgi:hypothetical protein